MAKNLVIVESPAKAKTLKKYFGADFEILASYGHVRDLMPKKGAVDTEHDFAMKYQLIAKNEKHVEAICLQVRNAEALFLATDADREGEAISWHLCELLRDKKALTTQTVQRVVFHEITKTAVQAAMKNPGELNMNLVYAQQARRALDYLVGFNLSPVMWKKIRRGLSAGRVQSPALRLIVEREEEIDRFISQEYWTIEADLLAKNQGFQAKLVNYQGEKLGQFSVTNEMRARELEATLIKEANGKLIVQKVSRSERKRNPTAPFTTSTLQQEASRKLGFTAQRTMRVAQQLYEGMDVGLGQGAMGLITYMRTDSVNLAQEALTQIREFIKERYGVHALAPEIRTFKTRSKNAQEAHEAIRPTMIEVNPESVKTALTPDQLKLYSLIWKRTLACQMSHAVIDAVSVELLCGKTNIFKATGSTIREPGFMAVYQEGKDEAKNQDEAKDQDEEKRLPPLKEGQEIVVTEIKGIQHFTEPPPKFTEASLVKTLEEHGIGRPSTYATIIATLQQREYAVLENKRFQPTDVGKIVGKFLSQYFTQYVDYDFTAKLEDELDAVSRGERPWISVLEDFWQPFIDLINNVETTVQRKDVTQESMDEACPKCQKPLSARLGKRGRFVGCTGYPDCDYTRSMDESADAPAQQAQIVEGKFCPKCESQLVIKQGRYGKFIGCSGYPNCKHIENLEKPEDTNVICPICSKGSLIKRKSRYGTFFYSCNCYPDCKYAIKHPPLDETCPSCGWKVLTLKTTKRRGVEKACPQKECAYCEPQPEAEVS